MIVLQQPRVVRNVGLVYAAAIYDRIFNIWYSNYYYKGYFGNYIGMAIENGLCRPCFPVYLSRIASSTTSESKAEYMSQKLL